MVCPTGVVKILDNLASLWFSLILQKSGSQLAFGLPTLVSEQSDGLFLNSSLGLWLSGSQPVVGFPTLMSEWSYDFLLNSQPGWPYLPLQHMQDFLDWFNTNDTIHTTLWLPVKAWGLLFQLMFQISKHETRCMASVPFGSFSTLSLRPSLYHLFSFYHQPLPHSHILLLHLKIWPCGNQVVGSEENWTL